MTVPKVRLYVEHPLAAGQSCPLTRKHIHYLFDVMRFGQGGELLVFNGNDGEFLAFAKRTGRQSGMLCVERQTLPLQKPPDLWLLFAPIKSSRTDFIVEKAAEMGASRILPVRTRFTNSERIRHDRLQRRVIEAIEQCGGTFVPEVCPLQRLDTVLSAWPADRHLMFCDEVLSGSPETLESGPDGKWAILIGPEGGFSDCERKRLADMQFVERVSLGPRILRADTAAVAAMAIWQKAFGDW